MSQKAQPVADVTVGGWTPTPLSPRVNEPTPDDGTYVSSTGLPGGDTFELKLAEMGEPGSGAHTLTVRLRKVGAEVVKVVVAVVQDTAVIAQRNVPPEDLSGVFTDFVVTLTEGEIEAITDYAALRVRVTVYSPVSSSSSAASGGSGGSGGSGSPSSRSSSPSSSRSSSTSRSASASASASRSASAGSGGSGGSSKSGSGGSGGSASKGSGGSGGSASKGSGGSGGSGGGPCCGLTSSDVLHVSVSDPAGCGVNGASFTLTWDGSKWTGSTGTPGNCNYMSVSVQCVAGNLQVSISYANAAFCSIGQDNFGNATIQCSPFQITASGNCTYRDFFFGVCCDAGSNPIVVTITK